MDRLRNYLDVKITPSFWALLAHRAWNPPPSSSLAEERTPPLPPPPCAGARFPTLTAWVLARVKVPASVLLSCLPLDPLLGLRG
jgi:hypothetical protein